MSFATPVGPNSAIVATPRRAYITTSAFNSDLYTYTITTNPTTLVKTGTLAANVTGATASTCPANRILRENGRRLYPDANPQISTLLVGVYDAVSGLNGFIDPNSPKFAIFNSDKANYMGNGIDPNGGLTDQGAPVYTRGTITSGAIAATGAITATTTVTGGTGLIATTGQIRSATATALTATGTVNQDFSLGQVYTVTPTGNITLNASSAGPPVIAVPGNGSVVYLVVTTSGTSSYNITFSAGFKSTAVLATGTVSAKVFTVTFVSDGTNLNEVARTTAM
jgi:hypothetical protein